MFKLVIRDSVWIKEHKKTKKIFKTYQTLKLNDGMIVKGIFIFLNWKQMQKEIRDRFISGLMLRTDLTKHINGLTKKAIFIKVIDGRMRMEIFIKLINGVTKMEISTLAIKLKDLMELFETLNLENNQRRRPKT
jgi:hypothetical protein